MKTPSTPPSHAPDPGNDCCGSDCCRRDFLTAVGASAGALAFLPARRSAAEGTPPAPRRTKGVIRVMFIYPPSTTFSNPPDGWWSWPGNEFDAEGRQRKYTEALREMEPRLGARIVIDAKPVATKADAAQRAREITENPPDGLLLVLFYNRSLHLADQLLAEAEAAGIPSVFYIGLGVKHGTVARYRRPGLVFIQSLDNLEAIERGLRMVHAKQQMGQSLLLSITEAETEREGVESFFGIRVRVIPFRRYADEFKKVQIDAAARAWLREHVEGAREIRGVSQEALDNATRAHLALKRLLEMEKADGLTMNCLKRGMLKPCLSFSSLNGDLIPAACENDLGAVYTQLLGQRLIQQPGFQHNPCFETEANHYYGSHCTCPTRIRGAENVGLPYLLRRFAHTNEGSCAIQVFWTPGEPVTMVRYHPGKTPSLDVYAGKVVASHAMPPAAGCTTNVEIEITDRPDACMVQGHHNLLFAGDHARTFRRFALLHRLELSDTGYAGPWPI